MNSDSKKLKLICIKRSNFKHKIHYLLILPIAFLFLGWGNVGHKIINYNTILSALPEMQFLVTWADSLEAHASDADIRKSWDPNEAPKHYIDIDNYPEFIATGTIPQSFDSVVAIHGYTFVIEQGILPWAILNTADSLETLFENNNMHQAMLIAADLGHYIGDAHNPLHITRNYNGQYTNQYGVHSRYESNLIQQFQSQIIYDGDTVQYIDNLSDFVFNMIYDNYQYVDSVLYADAAAYAFAGNQYNSTYYNKFWEIAKNFTINLFQRASYRLTCLIYTQWIDAGGAVNVNSENKINIVDGFNLFQNYPNPFNPSTKIQYSVNSTQNVTLKVYDFLGREVAILVNEEKSAGAYELTWDAANLPSGIYFYQIRAGSFVEAKKMVLLK